MFVQRFMLAAAVLAAATAAMAAAPQPRADQRHIQAHLSFLADDLLEGRETGSRGYDIAALYVANQLRQAGVTPKGDQGSYLQAVALRRAVLAPQAPKVELISNTGTVALEYLEDFLTTPSTLEDHSEITAPLVFVGYGIEAPRYGLDDYSRIDVKGKIVVVLGGNPPNFPSEEGAHFGSGEQKREAAARHGAVGLISVQTAMTEKRMAFKHAVDYRMLPTMGWVDGKGGVAGERAALQNRLLLSIPGGRKLFAQAGASLDELLARVAAGQPLPHMDLGMSMHMVKHSQRSDLMSSNVVGMVEGSDPTLKHEVVVFSAHLDHLGMANERTGDKIFNGAMDNASGVATLLEAARMFSQAGVRPKRSILFVAVTGEEKGLLGADYFANNPTVPIGAIVANINLDMPLLTFDFKNVIAFGAEHSSLKHSATRALASLGLGMAPDPAPEQSSFTRSDHYMFVRKGVPSLYIVTGTQSFKQGENPGTAWGDFIGSHYHQPSDDLTQPFNFEAAARFAQLNFLIGMEIANTPAKPTWNKGDFFGDLFSKK